MAVKSIQQIETEVNRLMLRHFENNLFNQSLEKVQSRSASSSEEGKVQFMQS